MIEYNKAFIDTAVFIYFLEKNLEFGLKAKSFFNYSIKYNKVIKTSVITYLEFCVKPYRDNKPELIEVFKNMLSEADIELYSIGFIHSDLASKLRAKYNFLKNFDALQLAVAIRENCDLFLTNDKKLKQISEIQVFTLSEI